MASSRPNRAQFRVEHVARKPRGWRVRTRLEGAHRIRIAFPPGPRRKGAGEVVEILHPKGEKNPECRVNPAELVIFGNPYGVFPSDEKSARKLFRSGHHKLTRFQTAKGVESLAKRLRKKGIKTTPFKYPEGREMQTLERLMGNPPNKRDLYNIWSGRKETRSQQRARYLKYYRPSWNQQFGAGGKNRWGETLEQFVETTLTAPNARSNPKRKARLTPQQDRVWEKAFAFYVDEGKSDAQADRLAWRDLVAEFPELKKHSGAHPNPKRRKRNQSDAGEERQAVQLFQQFHGRDPRGIVEKHVSDAMRREYTALGSLDYIIFRTDSGAKVTIDFEGDGVTLASSPAANQLYFIGGNQNISSCLGKFTDDPSKDFIDLGETVEVQYLARKAQGNFEPVKYFHKFGEQKRGSELPRGVYDKIRRQIFLAGGEYTIDSPGIVN